MVGTSYTRSVAIALVGAMLLIPLGCKINVNDLEKWRNRPGSEALFVEWMLDPEATPDVRSKAIEMLFEQYNYEGADFLPRVADLPQGPRDRAIMDALPHIVSLYEGLEFTLGGDQTFSLEPVQVRDAVFLLLETTETPETRTELMAIVLRWLSDNYRPCTLSAGRHSTASVLSRVGPGTSEQVEAGEATGQGVVINAILSGTVEQVYCQASFLSEITWLLEMAEAIAAAYTTRWRDSALTDLESQLQMVLAMLQVPGSSNMKNWVFEEHLANPESSLMRESPDAVAAFLDYVGPLATADDSRHFSRMIAERQGNVRWIAFEHMLRLGGADGLRDAMNAIPNAAVWGRWGGETREDGLARAATYICGRPTREVGDAARPVYEEFLDNENLVRRALAIRCLSEIGTASTLEALRPLARNNSVVPAWGPEEESTIGSLATNAIEAIESR